MASQVECLSTTRKLGHQESLFFSINQFPGPIGVYVNINMIESKKEITVEQVKKAFEKASEKNFLLRARVNRDENDELVFKPICDLRLKQDWTLVDEASMKTEDEWTGLLPKVLERMIDFFNGPLWHVKLVKLPKSQDAFNYVLICVFSHIISDGKCGFNLIANQIIPYLNNKTLDEKPIYFGKPLEAAVYDFSDDQLVLQQRSVPFIARAATNAFMLKNKIGISLSKLFGSDSNGPQIRNDFHCLVIDQEKSSAFIKLCKSRNVTVHSLMMTVIHNALHQARKDYQLNLNTDMLLYPIDTRKFNVDLNSPSHMPFGDYHKMGEHSMKFARVENEKAFFEMAQNVNLGIQEHNQPKQEKTIFDCLFHLLQNNNLSLDTFNALPPPTVFTNLGNLDVMCQNNDKEDLVVLKKHFFTLQTCSGVVVSACSLDKKMHIMVSNGQPLADGPSRFIGNAIKSNIEYLVEMYS